MDLIELSIHLYILALLVFLGAALAHLHDRMDVMETLLQAPPMAKPMPV